MRYVCGNCGSEVQGGDGCPGCNGPAFDLDTPRGALDMQEYREICRDRSDGLLWAGLWLLPLVILPLVARLVLAELGFDPLDDLDPWLGSLCWLVSFGAMALAYAVRRRLQPPAVRALDDRFHVGCMRPPESMVPLAPAPVPAPVPATPASRRASSGGR